MAIVTPSSVPSGTLATYRFTAWRGTTYERVAKAFSSKYEASDNVPEMVEKLEAGKVDALIDSQEIVCANMSDAASVHLSVKVLEQSDLPAEVAGAFEYPFPDGLYVDERETDLLRELNKLLALPEEQTVLEDISKAFHASK